MKIAVTAEGNDLSAPTSSRFGRCPTLILVDANTQAFEALPNPATSASGGAGVQAAQFVVEQDVQALLTANVGPNAMAVLEAAGVPVYLIDLIDGGTVEEVVAAYQAGRLQKATEANVPEHAGMKRGLKRPTNPKTDRDQKIAALQAKAATLRRELADVIDRIEQLEKEH